MTEAIKQWIAEQAANSFMFENTASYVETYMNALTKGIEIAEGFTKWANSHYLSSLPFDDKWYLINRLGEETFSTSQLLEKYLIYLKTLKP